MLDITMRAIKKKSALSSPLGVDMPLSKYIKANVNRYDSNQIFRNESVFDIT